MQLAVANANANANAIAINCCSLVKNVLFENFQILFLFFFVSAEKLDSGKTMGRKIISLVSRTNKEMKLP